MSTEESVLNSPITIIGAGAIGGTVGAYLSRAGFDVTLVDVERDHVDVMNEQGLRISGCRGENLFPVKAVHAGDVKGPLGATFLCVKGHFTESAMQQYGRMISEDGFVLSLQNGLNEQIIANEIGEERTVGCFVHFGADYLEPGHIVLGNEQTIHIGELSGAVTPRAEAIRRTLSHVMPVEITTNIWGFLWGKLVYGAMAFVVSSVDAPVPEVLEHDLGLLLAANASREAYLVGVAQTPKLENIGEFNPRAFAPGDDVDARAGAELQNMATAMRGGIKQHMGIWRDLAVKKRKTEIDMQSAVVVQYGKKAGISTPVNAATVQIVHEIEEGSRDMSWSNLEDIARIAGI